MKSLCLISLCLLISALSSPTQPAEAAVDLKLNRAVPVVLARAEILQAKAVEMLKTSNFNSNDHPDLFPTV
jgi:hypothetical protein